MITSLAFVIIGFSINLVTLLILFLIFFVKKYPYSLDGFVGFIPKINIFWSSKLYLFLLIDLFKIFVFSIKWSDVKYIKGCFKGISLIKAEDNIAGAVFFFAGSKTIL